jgi:hypothetical protein
MEDLSLLSVFGDIGGDAGGVPGGVEVGVVAEGEPGTTVLLFLRKRLERMRELVLRGEEWRELAGLPGVEGRGAV